MDKNDTRWHTISGGITHEIREDGSRWTIIRLGGRDLDGYGMGQRLEIETRRIKKPGMLKKVLDNMALDLRRYDLV